VLISSFELSTWECSSSMGATLTQCVVSENIHTPTEGIGYSAGVKHQRPTSPRISNPMVNNFSVLCTEIMGTHL